jgi:predicted GNAT family acetyltransferase
VSWHLINDAEVFSEQVGELLAAHPVENTITLTVLENIRAGEAPDSTMFGWFDDGNVKGAISFTPPHDLVLTRVPPQTADALVTALRQRSLVLPGVRGERKTTEAFAANWAGANGLSWAVNVQQRLYELDILVRPANVPGHARLATIGDLDIGAQFFTAFQVEVHDSGRDAEDVMRARIDGGLLWLWEDGAVVSMAARNRAAAGVSRVGPVYTPPQFRGHGYAAAVTAACSADVQTTARAALFTDLHNPTSNAIYQRLGYRPVRDEVIVTFGSR